MTLMPHKELLAGAKERIHDHSPQRYIETRNRGDAGKVAIGHCRRHEYRKHGGCHDQFRAQHGRVESFKESEPRHKTCYACRCSFLSVHLELLPQVANVREVALLRLRPS